MARDLPSHSRAKIFELANKLSPIERQLVGNDPRIKDLSW